MCSVDDDTAPVLPKAVPDNIKMDFVSFSESKVLRVLNNLKSSETSGSYGLPPTAFKKIKSSIAGWSTITDISVIYVCKPPPGGMAYCHSHFGV